MCSPEFSSCSSSWLTPATRAATGVPLVDTQRCWSVVSYVTYLGQMIYPAHLAVLYPYPEGGLRSPEFILAFLLLSSISVTFFLWRKKHPFLLIGWAWFVGMLVPMIGIVQVGSHSRADRYTYLPQIGLYIAATWSAIELVAKRPRGREMLVAAAALIITAIGARPR